MEEQNSTNEGENLTTWDSLHQEHGEIFVKMNILEKALADLLQKHTEEQVDRTLEQQKEFLEAFKQGLSLHFTVEEKALFPEMKQIGKIAESLVDELLVQHRSIVGKYEGIAERSNSNVERRTNLRSLVQELITHTKKEEESVYPLVKQMSREQLEVVDRTAKQLGYQV
jgi:hemerythrin-like domain-containing protein